MFVDGILLPEFNLLCLGMCSEYSEVRMSTVQEPSFRQSVDLMFNRAVRLMDLPPGLEEKNTCL